MTGLRALHSATNRCCMLQALPSGQPCMAIVPLLFRVDAASDFNPSPGHAPCCRFPCVENYLKCLQALDSSLEDREGGD